MTDNTSAPARTASPRPVSSGYWQELATTDFARLDTDRAIALLPVSACEQHGPHLPLCTDATINAGIVAAMLELTTTTPSIADQADSHDPIILVLPAQTIGDSIEHTAFPGTLTADLGTLVNSWIEIGAAVRRAGIRRMVIFNSHGGQRGHVDQAAVRLRVLHSMLVARANIGQLGVPAGLFTDSEQRFGLHGGAIETSLMLHLRPDLVRAEHLADFVPTGQQMAQTHQMLNVEKPIGFGWMAQDLNCSGASGDAASANPQSGAALLAHQADRLLLLCRELAATPLSLLRDGPPA